MVEFKVGEFYRRKASKNIFKCVYVDHDIVVFKWENRSLSYDKSTEAKSLSELEPCVKRYENEKTIVQWVVFDVENTGGDRWLIEYLSGLNYDSRHANKDCAFSIATSEQRVARIEITCKTTEVFRDED